MIGLIVLSDWGDHSRDDTDGGRGYDNLSVTMNVTRWEIEQLQISEGTQTRDD